MTVLTFTLNNTNEKDFRRFGSFLTCSRPINRGQITIKKLWHILANRNLKKKYLQEFALTHYEITNLSLGEDVTTDTIAAFAKYPMLRQTILRSLLPTVS